MNDDHLDPDATSDETWQPVRARLGDVAVPVEAREAAIAAALAVFDEMRAGAEADTRTDDTRTDDTRTVAVAAVAGSTAGPISLADRRRRQQRWLGRAAAVVAVVAVGGVAVNGLRGSSDQQVSVEPASAIDSSAKADELGQTGDVVDDQGSGSGNEAAGVSPDAVVDLTMAPMGIETVPTIASIEVAAAPESSAAATSTATVVPTETIADPAALADYAARTVAAPPMAGLPTSDCVAAGGTALGVVSYQGTTALVVLGPDGTYRAHALDTCTVLATVGP